MARFNAEGKQYTAEQEAQRDAEEKTWSDAAYTVAEKKFLKFEDLRLALEIYFA